MKVIEPRHWAHGPVSYVAAGSVSILRIGALAILRAGAKWAVVWREDRRLFGN